MSDPVSAVVTSGGTSYLAGAVLGGTTMSVLSAAGSMALEKKQPTPKTLARDFILGAILLLLILQLLPESTGKLITYVTSFISVPAIAAASSAGSTVAEVATAAIENVVGSAAADDIEVKVGVPRF